MRYVQPIRELKKISHMKNLLRGRWNVRDLLLFELALNSALRISDLLTVTSWDLFDANLCPRDSFEVKEMKTSKRGQVTITPKVKATLEEFAQKYPDIVSWPGNYVFFAQKTFPLGSDHIKRWMAWLILSNLGKDVGLESIGCHSTRKSWGYLANKSWIPLSLIQYKLNHSSLATTRAYLGITDDEVAEACNRLDI